MLKQSFYALILFDDIIKHSKDEDSTVLSLFII